MNEPIQENESVRKTLLDLMGRAGGLTQAQLAESIKFTPSRLSRILSGETDLTNADAEIIARGIGTKEAKQFAGYLNQKWELTPRPAFDHPSRESLWKAEQALQQLDAAAKEPGVKHAFAQQIESLRVALVQAAKNMHTTEHPVTLIGPPGVGKTTLLCTGSGLRRLNAKPKEDDDGIDNQMALQTGGGRTTISEVHARNGAEYSISVDPCSVDEISQFVSEFCDDLLYKETGKGTPEDYRIPFEVERAIRNMANLPPAKRWKTVDGQKHSRPDAAKELAAAFPNKQDLLVQIITRMDLPRRTKTSITYPKGETIPGFDWVNKLYAQINFGHHPEFSLPRRLEITTPGRVLRSEDIDIRMIDTRGVDEPSAPRRDLQAFLDDERCLIVLCTKFDDAPNAATLSVIDRAIDSGLHQAILDRGLMLVLPRKDEDEDQRDTSTGDWVESSEEGRDIKLDHVLSTLAHHGCQKLQVEFINVRSEKDCDTLRSVIVGRVRDLRKRMERKIDELIGVIHELVAAKTEEARAIFEAATASIRAWLAANNQPPKLDFEVHSNLIREMYGLRWASSLRASVNRRGNWHNFDYWLGLGFGARSETVKKFETRIEELKKLIKESLANPDYAPAHGFLTHFLSELEAVVNSFYQWVQSLGENVFKSQLGDDASYWAKCRDRWGGGGGYRDAVTDWTGDWFSEESRKQREILLQTEIQARWTEMMTKLSESLVATKAPGAEPPTKA
jgi:plasmid maintenance system antidote protein VapI